MIRTTQLPEANESLWVMIAGPVIWAGHFLLSYGTASIWCAKVVGAGGSLATARVAIIAYTVVALVAVATICWIGYRRHSFGSASLPHDDDTPEDRHRFLGFATLLLAALSAAAIVYEGLVVIFFDRCY